MKTSSDLATRTVREARFTRVVEQLSAPWSPDRWANDATCVYALLPPGRLVRPLLFLDTLDAFGVESTPFLPAAAAIEYCHVGCLVHDDIIDGDLVRRGRPSVTARSGLTAAILAGDALIFQMFAALTECRGPDVPDSRIVDATSVLARCGAQLCRGEMMEQGLAGDVHHDLHDYLTMAMLKSGSLFEAPCEIAAVLAGAPAQQVEALAGFGRELGVAYQIYDDLLPFAAAATDKPRDSDMRNRRVTVPVILAHRDAGPADRAVLEKLFTDPVEPVGPPILDRLAGVVERTGALEKTRQLAHEHVGRARGFLATLPEPVAAGLEAYPATILAERWAGPV